MPFVGDKGGHKYPEFSRARLLTGETWLKDAALNAAIRPGPNCRAPDRRLPFVENAGTIDLSTVNSYGLTSRSEQMFPEAFKPLDTKFWVPMREEERAYLVARQANANLRATYDDENMRPTGSTSADEAYAEASGRRYQSMRRRRKPMNHEERQKEAEARKLEPLVRRYSGGNTTFFKYASAFVKTGPLDTPILATGLPVLGASQQNAAGPKLLKRTRRSRKIPQVYIPPEPPKEEGLPWFSPLSANKVQLTGGFTNSPYGLTSRSEMLFPEAYRELSTVFWRSLSDSDRAKIHTVQARAMEKVGYEPGTEKQFIEEIQAVDDYAVHKGGRTDDTAGGSRGLNVESLVATLIILAAVAYLADAAWKSSQDGPQQLSLPEVRQEQPRRTTADGIGLDD